MIPQPDNVIAFPGPSETVEPVEPVETVESPWGQAVTDARVVDGDDDDLANGRLPRGYRARTVGKDYGRAAARIVRYSPRGLCVATAARWEYLFDRELGQEIKRIKRQHRRQDTVSEEETIRLQRMQAEHDKTQRQHTIRALVVLACVAVAVVASLSVFQAWFVALVAIIVTVGWLGFAGVPENQEILTRLKPIEVTGGAISADALAAAIAGSVAGLAVGDVQIVGPRSEPGSTGYTVSLSGKTAGHLIGAKDTLATRTGWNVNRIEFATNKQHPGMLALRLLDEDPDERRIETPPQPAHEIIRRATEGQQVTWYDGVPVGFRVDRREGAVYSVLRLHDEHLFIGGNTRNGKSTTVQTLVAAALCMPMLRLVVIDQKAKGSVDYLQLGAVANTHISGGDDEAAEAAVHTLEDLVRLLDVRSEWMTQAIRENPELFGSDANLTSAVVTHPKWGPYLHPVVVVIEEIHRLKGWPAHLRKRAESALFDLGSTGIAQGVHLLPTSQNMTSDIMETRLSAVIASRVCFNVPTREVASRVLGTAVDKLESDPTQLPKFKALTWNQGRWSTTATIPSTHAELAEIADAARQIRGNAPALIGSDGRPLPSSLRAQAGDRRPNGLIDLGAGWDDGTSHGVPQGPSTGSGETEGNVPPPSHRASHEGPVARSEAADGTVLSSREASLLADVVAVLEEMSETVPAVPWSVLVDELRSGSSGERNGGVDVATVKALLVDRLGLESVRVRNRGRSWDNAGVDVGSVLGVAESTPTK